MRYGQTISEGEFGGNTTESEGLANQDGAELCASVLLPLENTDKLIGGYGRADAMTGEGEKGQSREEQGYGGGSGVGA